MKEKENKESNPKTKDFYKLAKDLFEHLSSKEENGLDPLEIDWVDNWIINNNL